MAAFFTGLGSGIVNGIENRAAGSLIGQGFQRYRASNRKPFKAFGPPAPPNAGEPPTDPSWNDEQEDQPPNQVDAVNPDDPANSMVKGRYRSGY